MTHQRLLPEPVFQQCETHIPRAEEHHGRGEPDFETVQVYAVDGELEAEQDIVDDGNCECGGDTVCLKIGRR